MAYKVICMGYFWPIVKKDAKEFAQRCRNCQVHNTIQRNPSTKLTGITNPVPFDM